MVATDELDSLLEAALARAGEPLTADAARRALPAGRKPPKQEIQSRLRGLAQAKRIHRWPGRAEKFAAVSPQAFAREQVLRALDSGPLTEGEIKKLLSTSAKPLAKAALDALVAERMVLRHPKLGRRQPFGLHRPDPIDYLRPEIDALVRRLMKAGFEEEEVRFAVRRCMGVAEGEAPAAAENEILETMQRLNSQVSRGALVYLSKLRAALAKRFPDKESFDRAVLALEERGKVQLQSHAWPGRLSEEERRALVPNGRGGFFDAVGIRLE
jgi:hypothetical protein